MSRGGDAAWRNGEAARGKKRAGEVTAGKKQQGLKRAVALTTGFGHKHKTSRPLTPSSIHRLVDDFLFCIAGAVNPTALLAKWVGNCKSNICERG